MCLISVCICYTYFISFFQSLQFNILINMRIFFCESCTFVDKLLCNLMKVYYGIFA